MRRVKISVFGTLLCFCLGFIDHPDRIGHQFSETSKRSWANLLEDTTSLRKLPFSFLFFFTFSFLSSQTQPPQRHTLSTFSRSRAFDHHTVGDHDHSRQHLLPLCLTRISLFLFPSLSLIALSHHHQQPPLITTTPPLLSFSLSQCVCARARAE